MEGRTGSIRILWAIICAFVLLSVAEARSATKTWIYWGDGNWSEAAKWDPPGVPVSGDTVVLKGPYGTDIVYDVYSSGVTLTLLTFGFTTPTGQVNLLLASKTICDPNTHICFLYKPRLQADNVTVKGESRITQSGGTNTVNQSLSISEYGVYTLSGSGAISAGSEAVGGDSWGTGTFIQSGGTNSSAADIVVGAGSTGTYTLSGGSVTAAGSFTLGADGPGTLTLSGGSLSSSMGKVGLSDGWDGTVTQTGGAWALSSHLYLGTGYKSEWILDSNYNRVERFNPCNGTYNFSGGNLTVGGSVFMGYQGTATFSQTGGIHRVTGDLYLGYDAYTKCYGFPPFSICNDHRGVGTYNLSGSSSELSAASEILGYEGTGTVVQTGGTNTSTGALYLGWQESGVGTYHIQAAGGALTVPAGYVGYYGKGTFKQAAGTHTISSVLNLAYYATGNGTYELSGSGASLSANYEVIGRYGTGKFTHTAGTNTVGTSYYLGYYGGSTGRYELLGNGSLTAQSAQVGREGSGTFLQRAGSNKVTGSLVIAAVAGQGVGSYDLQGGTLEAGTIQVNAGGSFNQVSGSALKAGTFTQNGGTVTGRLDSSGGFVYNAGPFQGELVLRGPLQLNADFTAANGLTSYADAAVPAGRSVILNGKGLTQAQGTLNLSGGSLNAVAEEVGFYGTSAAVVNQTAGTNSVSTDLIVGSTSTGSYLLSGGGLTSHAVVIGADAAGTFDHSAGTNTAGSLMLGGRSASGGGTYLLRGTGSVSMQNEYVSLYGNGTFTQSGGNNTVSAGLFVGAVDGTYALSGGKLKADTVVVGYNGGRGTLRQTGGDGLEATSLVLGRDSGDNGACFLGAGTLKVGEETIGKGGLGSLEQTGGTHTVSGTLTIQAEGSSNGTLHLKGGSLGATSIVNKGTLLYSGGSLNGPIANSGVFSLSGAGERTMSGNVTNAGRVTVSGTTATFTGTFANDGAYESQNSVNRFISLGVGPAGYLRAGAGDEFSVAVAMAIASARATDWDTTCARLSFRSDRGPTNYLHLTGADLGPVTAGYSNNFAWGAVSLPAGNQLYLIDGNATPGAALYVGEITGLTLSGDQVTNVTSAFDVYYIPTRGGNAYLGGKTYRLIGGGRLISIVNRCPSLSLGTVSPAEGERTVPFRFTVHYSDLDGDAPALKQVVVDGVPHAMSLTEGSPAAGTYFAELRLDVGTHNYYFSFDDGFGCAARVPVSGVYSGPNVTPATLHVSSEGYPTIRAALIEARDGETVIVHDGVYAGPDNTNLDFGGKAVTVRSENGAEYTIIDCAGQARGIFFSRGESRAAVLQGFTIANGYSSEFGGGIWCTNGSSPIIRDCVIMGGLAMRGGGIACSYASSPWIVNCLIRDNHAYITGGGVYCANGSSPLLLNTTFTRNSASYGGALAGYGTGSNPEVINCILWGESPPAIESKNGALPSVSYSDIQGGVGGAVGTVAWGMGILDLDPRFVDPAGSDGVLGTWDDDYRLRPSSPCRNAGDPVEKLTADYGGGLAVQVDAVTLISAGDPLWIVAGPHMEPGTAAGVSGNTVTLTAPFSRTYRVSEGAFLFTEISDFLSEPIPNGGRIDLGFQGGTDGATPWIADVDGDDDTDGLDVATLASEFGREDCSPATPCSCDFDGDGDVDRDDLSLLAMSLGSSYGP